MSQSEISWFSRHVLVPDQITVIIHRRRKGTYNTEDRGKRRGGLALDHKPARPFFLDDGEDGSMLAAETLRYAYAGLRHAYTTYLIQYLRRKREEEEHQV